MVKGFLYNNFVCQVTRLKGSIIVLTPVYVYLSMTNEFLKFTPQILIQILNNSCQVKVEPYNNASNSMFY